MGYWARKFQALVGGKAKNAHNIGRMVTHKLPIPDVGGEQYYVQFEARCNSDGAWAIFMDNNCAIKTNGFKKVHGAINNLYSKTNHVYKHKGETYHDIETIFTMMQELEDAFLNYNPKYKDTIQKRERPNAHFLNAFETLPPDMQENIIMQIEHSKNTLEILPPRKINQNIVLPGHRPPSN